MKKIISFVLAAAMSLSTLPALADWNNDEDIMSLLSELNIMVGDDDGNLRLDDNVSRAEFAKIAVASSSYKDTVATGLKVSPFKDVTYTHWSAPYIKAAVSAGIAEGYVDSTFRPDNTVSYEEALTMVLKVLGYTTQDFGDSWPYGQMGLANSLEITKNVNAEQGEALTRRQVARLIYNTLDTKIKDNQSKLITSVFDSKVIEGVTIIASHNEDSSLGTDKIYTTAGTFEFDGNFNSDYVGRKGDIVVKNDEDFVSFTPRDQQVEEYTVSNVIGSDIILDGDMYNINSNTTTYYKSQALTYENAAMQAEKGDTFKLFKNSNGSVDYAMLEYCIREDLKLKRPRLMAVLDPIKLVIDNYPEGEVEYLEAPNNMENEKLGTRKIPFGRELYIEREDFMVDPPKKYKRMFPGTEVRLMNAYFVTCTGYEADEDGTVRVVHCTYDPATKGGNAPDGRKVKGTIHWVEASQAGKAEVRLYENIVDEEKGVYNKEDGSLNVNPNSLTKVTAYVEPALMEAKGYDSFQFVRTGFFCADIHDSKEGAPVFNRIVSLKSSFKLPKA